MSGLQTGSKVEPSALPTPKKIPVRADQGVWTLAGSVLILRVFTSLWAAAVSTLLPRLPLEQAIPVWPPSFASPAWWERVFLSPWQRWDAEWFLRIVTQGYRADDGTAQFHPLYPWLSTPLHHLGIHPLLSLLIVSTLSTFLLILVFYKLAQLHLPKQQAYFSTIFFLLFPVSFIFYAPYSEGLFLLFSVSAFLSISQKKWWLAGGLAGLATLTRQQGLFLLLPLAWELWENNDKDLRKSFQRWRDWLSLCMIPAGYLIWLVYRWSFLSDLNTNTTSLNSFIYSLFISPSANQVVDIQGFLWPWQALWIALRQLFTRPDIDLLTNLFFAVYFLALLPLSWKHLPVSYQLYIFVITSISFSYHTGPIHPYMGLIRHLLLAFPVFIGLGGINDRKIRLSLLAFNQLGFFFLLSQYVFLSWTP